MPLGDATTATTASGLSDLTCHWLICPDGGTGGVPASAGDDNAPTTSITAKPSVAKIALKAFICPTPSQHLNDGFLLSPTP